MKIKRINSLFLLIALFLSLCASGLGQSRTEAPRDPIAELCSGRTPVNIDPEPGINAPPVVAPEAKAKVKQNKKSKSKVRKTSR